MTWMQCGLIHPYSVEEAALREALGEMMSSSVVRAIKLDLEPPAVRYLLFYHKTVCLVLLREGCPPRAEWDLRVADIHNVRASSLGVVVYTEQVRQNGGPATARTAQVPCRRGETIAEVYKQLVAARQALVTRIRVEKIASWAEHLSVE